ncbi:dsRBD fold-containing protein [Rhodococcus sp. NPDC019627]|uniref:dsRBD fold-containing protein n=1 Tax=unclassified Rhodococcus (in: high G+C Gram-positive bacteria) TaxID=192944 RepID=UPI0033DDF377
MSMYERKWSVDIVIDEHDSGEAGSRTRAQARLRTHDKTALTGVGTARRNPKDTEIPEIGDELAAARALADLSHQLIEATVADLEAATYEHIHLEA